MYTYNFFDLVKLVGFIALACYIIVKLLYLKYHAKGITSLWGFVIFYNVEVRDIYTKKYLFSMTSCCMPHIGDYMNVNNISGVVDYIYQEFRETAGDTYVQPVVYLDIHEGGQ